MRGVPARGGSLGADDEGNQDVDLAAHAERSLAGLRAKLLDLKRSNALLNLRQGKSVVRVIDEVPEYLFGQLLGGGAFSFASLRALERDEGEEDEAQVDDEATGVAIRVAKEMGLNPSFDLPRPTAAPPKKHSDFKIQTRLFPDELEGALEKLRRKTNTFLQELGVPTLYFAFGFLEWFEADHSDKANFAPLVLMPVTIERQLRGSQYVFEVRVTEGGEPQINATLRVKLRRDFNLELPEALNDEKEIGSYFQAVERTVAPMKRWAVRRFMTLGTFRFERLVMWEDLGATNGEWKPTSHPVLKRLMGAEASDHSVASTDPDLDSPEFERRAPLLVTDADSSQTMAVVDALQGHNLVVRGPPGTGKSQTITNMIAAAISSSKSVLFVAEKMAALDVVRKRLEDAGLGAFALELHSTAAPKRSVMDQLQRRMAVKATGTPSRWQDRLAEVCEKRDALNQYLRAVNAPFGNLGITLYEILWRLEQIRATSPVPAALTEVQLPNVVQLSTHQLAREQEQLQTLCRLHREVRESASSLHPWEPFVERPDIQLADEGLLLARMTAWAKTLTELQATALALLPNRCPTPDEVPQVLRDTEQLALPQQLSALADALSAPMLGSSVEPTIQALNEIAACAAHLRQISSTPAAVGQSRAAFAPFVSAVRELEKGDLTLRESRSALQEAATQAKGLHDALPHLRRIGELCGAPTLPLNADGVRARIQLVAELRRTERKVLLARTRSAVAEKPPELLHTITAEIERVRSRIVEHDKSLSGWRTVTADECRDAATTLRITGWWGRLFGGAFRAARAFAVKITRGTTTDRFALANQAEEVAQTLEEMRRLENDARLTAAGIEHLDWANTDLQLLTSVDEWAKHIREATASGDQMAAFVRRTLLASPLDVLDAVQHELADESVGILERWVSKQLPLDLENTAQRFGDLARLGTQLLDTMTAAGIRQETKLSELVLAAKLLEQADAAKQVLVKHQPLAQALGPSWQVVQQQPRLLRDALEWTTRAQRICDQLGLPPPRGAAWSEWAQATAGRVKRLSEAASRETQARTQAQETGVEVTSAFTRTKGALADLIALANIALAAAEQLHPWLQYRRARASVLNNPRLAGLVRAIDADPHLGDHYPWLVYRDLVREAAKQYPQLETAAWSGETLEATRQRFAALDVEVIKLQRAVAQDALLQRTPPWGNDTGPKSTWTELALVKNEVNKEKRHIPVRDLVNRSPLALQALFPCFMMSPLSVAQFLPRKQEMFDLVIIDEASQMRPEDATGAVLRAKQLVVVGDEKQLPPTSFFESSASDDEETETESVESILDWGQSAFTHARELLWHYRSRHESLISFSNEQFYGGRLQVFPSPESSVGRGVQLVEVDGVYHASLNHREAERVVQAALHFMRTEPERSLGIVAMNHPQSELILTLLDDEIRKSRNDEYRERWAATLTPFFVKNLESVQGDERDVMFVSLTYGPSREGSVFQRFGPVNGADGHRRLNVLLTRAREEVRVFSSLRPSDIRVETASRLGVRVLRDYLEFAHAGGRLLTPGATERKKEHDSPFEAVVSEFLMRLGFAAEPQVGVKGFFIDLALRHPDYAGGFVCGVECDGAAFHSTRSARDRDRLRQEVLERLGWKIIRVWSTDWFRTPDKAREKLKREVLSALQQRLANPRPQRPPPPPPAPPAPPVPRAPAPRVPQETKSAAPPVVPAAARRPPGAQLALLEPGPTTRPDAPQLSLLQPPPPAPPDRTPPRDQSDRDPLAEAILRNLPPEARSCPSCDRQLILGREDRPTLRCTSPSCSRVRVEPPFEALSAAVEQLKARCQCGEALHVVKDPYRFPGCSAYRTCQTKHSWAELRTRLKTVPPS